MGLGGSVSSSIPWMVNRLKSPKAYLVILHMHPLYNSLIVFAFGWITPMLNIKGLPFTAADLQSGKISASLCIWSTLDWRFGLLEVHRNPPKNREWHIPDLPVQILFFTAQSCKLSLSLSPIWGVYLIVFPTPLWQGSPAIKPCHPHSDCVI